MINHHKTVTFCYGPSAFDKTLLSLRVGNPRPLLTIPTFPSSVETTFVTTVLRELIWLLCSLTSGQLKDRETMGTAYWIDLKSRLSTLQLKLHPSLLMMCQQILP